MASPMLAVRSNISISNAPRILVKPVKANLKPPPAIVVKISMMANKPLKERVNLSAVS